MDFKDQGRVPFNCIWFIYFPKISYEKEYSWTLSLVPSSSNICKENSKIWTKLRVAKRRRKTSWEECRDSCNIMDECEYFNYYTKKSKCVLFKVKSSTDSNYISGKKNCNNDEGKIFILCPIYHIILTDRIIQTLII